MESLYDAVFRANAAVTSSVDWMLDPAFMQQLWSPIAQGRGCSALTASKQTTTLPNMPWLPLSQAQRRSFVLLLLLLLLLCVCVFAYISMHV